MTKAGLVRFHMTEKRERTGVNSRKKKIPRLRYKELYEKRIIKKQYGGQQNSIGGIRHDRGKKHGKN